MAEVEIHAGQGHEIDAFGRSVGVLVGIIGIVLAVTTIGAHRAHSATIITRTEANDRWAFFQAKKERAHLQDVGATVAQRVVLYEEDPNDPQGKRAVGNAIWRTDAISPGTGKARVILPFVVLGIIAAGFLGVVYLWWRDTLFEHGQGALLVDIGEVLGLIGGYGVIILVAIAVYGRQRRLRDRL